MKKLFSFLAMMLLFAACQTEPGFDTNENGLVTARFSVGAHEISTRADETTATTGFSSALGAIDNFTDADWANYNLRFIFEVYAKDDNGSGNPIAKERQVQVVDKFDNDDAVFFEVRLVPNKEYKFVVFADFVNNGTTAEDVTDLYYDTTDLRNITMIASDDKMKPMNEARDAYFITENRVIKTDIEAPLTLTRPFGKIRVVTTDYEHIEKYAAPAKAVVEYYNHEILKSFNAVNGQISTARQGDNELKFEYDLAKDKLYTADRDSKSTDMTLFADYLLARPEGQSEVNFILSVYDAQGGLIKSNDFNLQIPIERNHLTTIEGNLLTTQTNIKVTINDDLTELTPIVWEEAVEEDVESWENGQVDTDGNYEFVVNGKTDSFLVTVNNEAVVNGKLTPGTYTLADKAAIDDKLTFTVKHNGTRAAKVNILNGHMIVEANEANEANEAEYTIDLNLHYEKVEGEKKEEYKVSYNYTGEITIAEPLATPVVEAKVEGNVVTLTWAAVEGAAQYGITVGTEMPVFVEETTYTFTGEYETEYTFNVVAISEDNASEPATVTVTTEAAPAVEAYKLYFNNLANWTKVYAHIWANEGEDLGLESVEWPGRELTETEELDGVTYYVFQLPAVATGKTLNVVFNDGAGTQTKDLAGVVEGNLFFDNYVEPVAPSETILYLQPNANWNVDGARFAAYFFGNGETWVDMTLVEGETNIYAVTVPTGFENIIFCRMNPGAAANNWNNKWNQTADLKVPTDGTNLYTVKENTWDNGGGEWSVYTPAVEPEEPTALATPVVEAVVEGNLVTLSWEAIEGAKDYTTTYGDKQLVVEGTSATFEAVVGTLTATVVANPADETKNTASEAGTVEVTVEAPVVEPEVPTEGSLLTINEFINLANTEVSYQITGVISNLYNTKYGNCDLTDETGTIRVYGILNEDGSKTGAVEHYELREGDTVTLQGKYALYGTDTHEIVDATVINHIKAPFISADPVTVDASSTEATINVSANVAWTVTCDADWVSFNTTDTAINVTFDANTGEERTATFTLSGEGIEVDVKLTQAAYGATDTKGTYTSEAFFMGGTDGGKSHQEKVNVGGTQYDCLKLGTSSVIGKYTTKAVGESGDLTLSFYAVGWNGKTSKLNVYVDGVKVGETLTLNGNSGAANNTPYTITPSDTTDYYSISVPGITETSKITFETVSGATRAIIFGVQLY